MALRRGRPQHILLRRGAECGERSGNVAEIRGETKPEPYIAREPKRRATIRLRGATRREMIPSRVRSREPGESAPLYDVRQDLRRDGGNTPRRRRLARRGGRAKR